MTPVLAQQSARQPLQPAPAWRIDYPMPPSMMINPTAKATTSCAEATDESPSAPCCRTFFRASTPKPIRARQSTVALTQPRFNRPRARLTQAALRYRTSCPLGPPGPRLAQSRPRRRQANHDRGQRICTTVSTDRHITARDGLTASAPTPSACRRHPMLRDGHGEQVTRLAARGKLSLTSAWQTLDDMARQHASRSSNQWCAPASKRVRPLLRRRARSTARIPSIPVTAMAARDRASAAVVLLAPGRRCRWTVPPRLLPETSSTTPRPPLFMYHVQGLGVSNAAQFGSSWRAPCRTLASA